MRATMAVLFCSLAALVLVNCVSTHQAYRYGEVSQVLLTGEGEDRRISGIKSKFKTDFVLGGLLHIHSEDPSKAGGKCGPIRDDEELEAMLFAIDSINADQTLIPNVTFGFDVRDTCYSENIALDETVDLIIAGSELYPESCEPLANGAGETNPNASGSASSSSLYNKETTLGLIGAEASRVSRPVASLARLFRVPQISPASSSPSLSNRDRYTYFYRTIPPDDLQARAMVDLAVHFNWTHISTVYSNDAYGKDGIEQFHKLAEERGICVDLKVPIEDDYVDSDYKKLAMDLYRSESSAAILFTHEQNANLFFTEVAKLESRSHTITWIGSEAWAKSISTIDSLKHITVGYFGVSPAVEYSEAFYQNYLAGLTLETNKRNAWFPDFFSALAGGCDPWQENTTNACNRTLNIFQLNRTHERTIYGAQTIDAVYAFAHALHDFLTDNCADPLVWISANKTCIGQKMELNGESLLQYIHDVSFTSPTGNKISFDENGNVKGRYEILNYRYVDSKRHQLLKVGTWKDGVLDFDKSLYDTMQYGIDKDGGVVTSPPLSQCALCAPGQYLLSLPSSCCGKCQPCLGASFSNSSYATVCYNCTALGDFWGNSPTNDSGSSGCVKIEEVFLTFSHPWSIVIVVLSVLGLLCVAATTVIFGMKWTSPVVKSSGREQMILLLFGIATSFLLPVIYISPPSLGVCVIQRVGIWLCISLTFGAIFVKVLRVYRIFLNKGSMTHVRFTEPHYQIIFTLFIVGVQVLIVAASIGLKVPGVNKDIRRDSENSNNFPVNILSCVPDHTGFLVLSIAYESLVVIAATVLGVLSFKFPKNFNEARFISFCTFALLLIWLTFIPSYFISSFRIEFQSTVIAMAILMTAYAELSCLFGHKLFVIIFRKEENQQQAQSQSTYLESMNTLVSVAEEKTPEMTRKSMMLSEKKTQPQPQTSKDAMKN